MLHQSFLRGGGLCRTSGIGPQTHSGPPVRQTKCSLLHGPHHRLRPIPTPYLSDAAETLPAAFSECLVESGAGTLTLCAPPKLAPKPSTHAHAKDLEVHGVCMMQNDGDHEHVPCRCFLAHPPPLLPPITQCKPQRAVPSVPLAHKRAATARRMPCAARLPLRNANANAPPLRCAHDPRSNAYGAAFAPTALLPITPTPVAFASTARCATPMHNPVVGPLAQPQYYAASPAVFTAAASQREPPAQRERPMQRLPLT
ncbi:hypothetical protein B0H13DRAFT_2320656 [Mycena leptocephala]|nr:hypothetical protein B0H13DRAFT_2320656 [Mycena leptocephala]